MHVSVCSFVLHICVVCVCLLFNYLFIYILRKFCGVYVLVCVCIGGGDRLLEIWI